MLSALLAISLVQSQNPIQGSRYEMGERLKALDIAWIATEEKGRRESAVNEISRSVMAFFGGRFAQASKSLDTAAAVLQGRTPTTADALTLRFVPAVVEPGQKATIEARWAYEPAQPQSLIVKIGSTSFVARSGQTIKHEFSPVPPPADSADAAQMREMGLLVSAEVDRRPRNVYISIVKNFRSRIEAIQSAKHPIAKAMAGQLKSAVENPWSQEIDVPILENLSLAESIEDGKTPIWSVEHIPLGFHGSTYFRAAFPPQVLVEPDKAPAVNVVIGFHGAGGSENLYFEGYGRGLAAQEALKRGWVFISPRVSQAAPQDVYDWLVNERKLKIDKLFVMGHSMGAGFAMSSWTLPKKPVAAALFAPANTPMLKEWLEVPIYMAIGKQELPRLLNSARMMSLEFKDKPGFVYQEFDPCEHLMIVADAVKPAYLRFDEYAKR